MGLGLDKPSAMRKLLSRSVSLLFNVLLSLVSVVANQACGWFIYKLISEKQEQK